MHHCLYVEELVSRIAEACAPAYNNPDNARSILIPGLDTLCTLAQTCRALQNPVLNVLWYHKVGLHHFIQCMPKDAWEITGNKDSVMRGRKKKTQIRFTRDITSDDWNRFDFYASRVRRFQYRQGYPNTNLLLQKPTGLERVYIQHPEPTVEVFDVLFARALPIFPHLQGLSWFISPAEHDPYGHSFRFLRCHLAPTLTSITIIDPSPWRDRGMGFADALSLLPIHSPNLEEINIITKLEALDVEFLMSALQPLKQLQRSSLSISAICDNNGGAEPKTLTSLGSTKHSQLSDLRRLSRTHTLDLSILIPSKYTRTGDRVDSPPFEFTSVNYCTLSVLELEFANMFFQDTFFPSAERLLLNYYTLDSASMDQHSSAIRSSFSPTSLQRIHLRASSLPPEDVQGQIVLPSSIYSPLRDFRNLRVVIMDNNFDLSITDTELEAFGRAWPHLAELHISGIAEMLQGTQETAVDRPTYKGIASLVRLCPDLRQIFLTIKEEAHSVRAFLERGDAPVSPHKVRLGLSLYPSVHDLDTMALWVAKMFPRYESIVRNSSLEETHGNPGATWTELEALVDRYIAV